MRKILLLFLLFACKEIPDIKKKYYVEKNFYSKDIQSVKAKFNYKTEERNLLNTFKKFSEHPALRSDLESTERFLRKYNFDYNKKWLNKTKQTCIEISFWIDYNRLTCKFFYEKEKYFSSDYEFYISEAKDLQQNFSQMDSLLSEHFKNRSILSDSSLQFNESLWIMDTFMRTNYLEYK